MSRSRTSSRDLLGQLVDPSSFRSWDQPIDISELSDAYRSALLEAQARSGTDEAVVTGSAAVDGHRVALVISEFGFLGGSIGIAAARRIVDAVHRATAEQLPLIAAPASGGTRMQEGTPAFLQMITIARAVDAHKAAGLPYVVYLRHPTTGGVLASWASLGHLLFAEPAALIGFLGPAVYEALQGERMPPDVQVAETLARQGVVDDVVPLPELGATLARTLALLQRPTAPPLPPPPPAAGAGPDGWTAVRRTREPGYLGVRDLLHYAADDVVWLHGRAPTGPHALVVALVVLRGRPCLLLGHDRTAAAHGARFGTGALRRVRRAIATAQGLRLPLVTVIDTAGAELSLAAEKDGIATEIAGCLSDMLHLTVPSVAVLLGQGTGGGALALLPAGRIIATENAWLTPLPPEGASMILHRTTERAAEFARTGSITARELLDSRVIDAIVAAPTNSDATGDARYCTAIADECNRQINAQHGAG